MGLAVRLLLGSAGFVVFASLTVEEARSQRDRLGLPVAWLLVGTSAAVLAGFIHLALTPEHWYEARLYGSFFLASGVIQLVLASLFVRPGPALWVAVAIAATNIFLIAVYAGTRIVPPIGAEQPEVLDAIGLVTVAAESVAAVTGLSLARRLLAPRSVRAPRGTGSSCPGPRARAGDSGTRTDR